MQSELILTHIDRGVGIVTFNRPDARNALNEAMMRAFNQALEAFEDDDAVNTIIVTGGPRLFCAGADIKEMRSRTFVPGVSAGWTKVHSENFVSRVIACICSAVSPAVSMKTAN